MPPTNADLTTTGAPPAPPPQMSVPPAPADVRTDRFDWVFVGYPWATKVTRNAPSPPFYAEGPDDVPAAAAVWLARRADANEHPYVWLAPELAQAFEDAAAASLARELFEGVPAAALDAAVDLTRYDAACAAAADPLNVAVADRYEAAALEAEQAVDAQLMGPLGDAWPDFDITDLLANRDGAWPRRHGTLGQVAEAHCRAEARAALYDHRRWYVLLRPPADEEDRLKRAGKPWLKTAGNVSMRQEQDYQALAGRTVLPVAADRLYGWLREWHEEHQRADQDCGAFPSKERLAKWLKENAVADPAPRPADAPAPDARLADAVEDAIDDLSHRPRAHQDGPTSEQVRRRVRRSRDVVEATLDWLVRNKGYVRSAPGAHGRVGYLPPVSER